MLMHSSSKYGNTEYAIVRGMDPINTWETYDIMYVMRFPQRSEYMLEELKGIEAPPVELVGWYFGEYDYGTTEQVIEEWFGRSAEGPVTKEGEKSMSDRVRKHRSGHGLYKGGIVVQRLKEGTDEMEYLQSYGGEPVWTMDIDSAENMAPTDTGFALANKLAKEYGGYVR